MEFTVRYFDPPRAAVVQERVDAPSEVALRAQLDQSGRVILELRKARTRRRLSRVLRARFDMAWWCRELRTLLKAGMTVVEALETLQAQSAGPQAQRDHVHAELIRALREGKSLSQAMRSVNLFPDVLVASVTASERTSTLVAALDDFLRYDEILQRMKRHVVSAAIYPSVVVVLGGGIGLFLLLYVIPRFSMMYAGVRGAVSPATQALLYVSRTFSANVETVVGLLALSAAVLAWAARSGALVKFAERLLMRIEPLQGQWDQFRLAKLYQSLALTFRGGYTLDEALAVCAGLGLGSRMTVGVHRAREELARGRGVAAAFAAASLTETVSQRLLAVGERSGSFDAVLQTIADRHAEAFTTFIERATRIVEPLLLLVVALVVGGIVVMMYMPIFDIASSVR